MKTRKKTIQKPIDIDVHFKYRCARCGSDHWISLKEAQTKNFKIVCHCSKVFKPKRIDRIKIKYFEDIIGQQEPLQKTVEPVVQIKESEPDILVIDKEILDICVDTLTNYGFTKAEASDLIKQVFESNPSNDCGQLIKQALKNFGGMNE